MNDNPLVSIIVPVYNVEKYMDKCLESVVGQTYKNLEIILVDDGSKDKSGELCDAWEKRDKRIKVIHKQNGGLSSARNAALDICNGEYLYFLDSDDYIDGKAIEIMMHDAVTTGAQIVEAAFMHVYKDKETCRSSEKEEVLVMNTAEAIRYDLSATGGGGYCIFMLEAVPEGHLCQLSVC